AQPSQEVANDEIDQEGDRRRDYHIFAPLRMDRGETPFDGGHREGAVVLIEFRHRRLLRGGRRQAQRRGCSAAPRILRRREIREIAGKRMAKIKVKNPLIEIDGDEMTRIIWQWIREQLIQPYLDVELIRFDLSIEN